MKSICPYCEVERDVESVSSREVVKVRDESITVNSTHLKCKTCGQKFDDPESAVDPLDLAYRAYREKHGLVQPETIVNFREKFGLTQVELAALLGWGIATLSRYENGALQSEAHERALRLVQDPLNFFSLLSQTGAALPPERKALITTLLRESMNEEFLNKVSEILKSIPGNETADVVKFRHVVRYFCKDSGGVWKTKLNKLLFYADFKHYHDYRRSITGVGYIAYPHGPVPICYEKLFGLLADAGDIEIREEAVEETEYVGERLRSISPPDISKFSKSEMATLELVRKKFQRESATSLREISHNEPAWIRTKGGDIISWDLANTLQGL